MDLWARPDDLHVLILSDGGGAGGALAAAIAAEGWRANVPPAGGDGWRRARDGDADVLVLDGAPPGACRVEFCRTLRGEGVDAPILMLTGHADAGARVKALRAGADDCLAKPCALDELVARIAALGRRGARGSPAGVFVSGPLRYDAEAGEISVSGASARLTGAERALLALLVARPGKVFTREVIHGALWNGSGPPLTNIIDVYVARLRKKLREAGPMLETVRGAGYRFRASAPDGATSVAGEDVMI